MVLVEDNGIGIPADRMEAIFMEGVSGFGTSGWGLHFLNSRITDLDGTYDVESEVGKGTRFYMYFKLSERRERPDRRKIVIG